MDAREELGVQALKLVKKTRSGVKEREAGASLSCNLGWNYAKLIGREIATALYS
jgi:hypothetical protein